MGSKWTRIWRVCPLSCPVTGCLESGTSAGNAFSSCTRPMPLDTQMTIALLQELLLALRDNDSNAFKAWLSQGIERLGEPAVIELMCVGLDPILTTDEADRLVGWHLGVSL